MRNPRTKIAKRTPHGRTLEHLTQAKVGKDHYRYYHATKGWRTRRSWTMRDVELPR